jgi:hypothetical protein
VKEQVKKNDRFVILSPEMLHKLAIELFGVLAVALSCWKKPYSFSSLCKFKIK